MTIKHVAFDGKSNFFLDQYPESAWVQLSPTTSDMADSRAATQAATNYYQSVAFLFRCVQIRQAALLNVPWAVVRNDKDIWTSEDSKPPADLAFMANFRRLLRNTEAALCLAPEAFWFRERNRARTLSLKWHAPSSVMPQYSESEGLTGFKRILGGGKERTFEKDDYIYFALPNPMHETIPGRPPAQAAMAAAGVLYNVDAFASAFFSRGAIKATLLTVEGNPQNSEMLKLESWWKRFFSGVKSAWETAAVRAGVKPVIIGEGMESLNQSTLTRERKEDIATALGIPHSIVMSDAANRSVAETDDLHFYDKTIIPEMEFLAETLNDQLFGPLGYEFVLRPQSMTVFQENEEERSMSLLHYTQAGFPAHVAAEILGIDLPEGMDYAELAELISGQQAQRDAVAISAMQARQTQTPRTVEAPETVQETQQGTPPAESQSNTRTARLDEIRRFKAWAKKRNNPDPSKFRSDILSEDEKRAILADEVSADTDFFTVALPSVWSGQNIPSPSDSIEAFKALVLQMDDDDDEAEQRARDAIERAAAEELAAALERQRRALLPSNVTPTSATDVVGRVDETSGTVRDALRRMLILSADLGVSVAIAQFETIGFGFDWTLVNTDARDWANRYTGELITMINDTTRRQVQQAVVQWIENGDPLSALIRELAPTFGRDRAGLIASTEVTRAYAEANLLAYRQSGVVSQVQWMTSNDERVCPICAPLGGLTFGDGRSEPASIDDQNRRGVLASLAGGFIHPGGNGAAARFAGGNYRIPPAHPRCRCWIVPVIDEPEAAQPATTQARQQRTAENVRLELNARFAQVPEQLSLFDKEYDDLLKMYQQVSRDYRSMMPSEDSTPEFMRERAAKREEMASVFQKAEEILKRKEEARKRFISDARELVYVENPSNVKLNLISKFKKGDPRLAEFEIGKTEFEKLVSGIVDEATIGVKAGGKGRSSYSLGKNTMNITSGTGSKIVIHEMGHWWEDIDPTVHEKALAFLERRTKGETAQRLKDIYPGSGYHPSEIAKKDKFERAYTGKIYMFNGEQVATEIVSMGLESMYTDPAGFAQSDPDFFDFIYNLARGQ